MKRIISILALVLAVLMVCGAFAACSSDKKTDTASKADAAETQAAETEADATEAPAEVDYTDVALTIEDGDFDAMEAFLASWESGQYDGKVIKVTGISEQRMSNCTVIERNAEDNAGRGFSWEIVDGKFPDDYPADGAKVTLVGVMTIVNEYGARALMVPKENITVVE